MKSYIAKTYNYLLSKQPDKIQEHAKELRKENIVSAKKLSRRNKSEVNVWREFELRSN